ncbi:MAG: peptidylprolyl isomerase [Bacteroidota bacterium]|nr:peptidylprolyl isomerase [Bacteroidota bacterium]
MIIIQTDLGDLKVKLYDQTPLHRDNFIKLVQEGFYDGTLFHRIIKDFMIQGGDPDSKTAKPGQSLGSGDLGYTVPAEFVPELFHKKGVLAAARQGDPVNPEKRSSASQFYIVQGRVFSNGALDSLEAQSNMRLQRDITMKIQSEHRDELLTLRKERKVAEFNDLIEKLELEAKERLKNSNPFKFSPEQRKAYTTIGGTPHLDREYTVFGEIVEGLDIIDEIANSATDPGDRPVKDIRMKIVMLP